MTDAAPAIAWTAAWVEPAQEPTDIERWTLLDWIRGARPDTPPEERLRPLQLLRQSFDVERGLVRATLHASARGAYSGWANGARIGDEVLAPGFDSYLHRLSFQTYDVTDALVAGANVLAFALADGWWAGRIGITGSSAQFGDRTAMIWQLELEYSGGRAATVVSGDGAVSRPGPWTYADLFIGERYDRRAEPAGWTDAPFDDADWTPVLERGHDTSTLVRFTGEPIRRVLELDPDSLRETDEGLLVDFGQVIVGRVRIALAATSAGQEITIEHTEVLAADGSWFQNVTGMNKEQTDVFVATGGDDEWEPEFTFHGFRYARVRGLRDRAQLTGIRAVVIASDLAQTGSFACSDPRLTKLHENVVWSQRGNFISIPTDCPQRERVGWTGDIQVFAAAATNNADVRAFLTRWLENLRADQLPDGGIPITSPRSPFDIEAAASATGLGAIVTSAGWSDAIAFVPWTLWERYGDRAALEDNYPSILRWIDYQRTAAAAELPAALAGVDLGSERRARQALLWNTGDHFGDWLTPSTLEGGPPHEAILRAPRLTSELIAPMFQAQTLTIAAHIAGVLGRAEASDLASRAAAVRAAFAAEYVDADGELPVRLQGVYVLALAFDMVPAGIRDKTAARLAELVRERGDRLDTGFLSVPYLLDVLWDTGYRDLARQVLHQTEQPSWLYEVDHGATTIWESWDAVAPDGTPRPVSFNHYAFGCVDDWLYRRVAGLQPTSPGWRTVTIEPDLDSGIEWVQAHVGTPFGRLAVAWTRAGDGISVSATVPEGVRATLVAGGEEISLLSGASRHIVGAQRSP
ncbi:family 78 glycoside hydrolase catalytic domain [Microbacterium sp. NPDC019599]|uniref:family 78 glycoside hydrolase catalytic domain n=1 Tax=Microbacterium sp. NPDC019599 TaxID=3154690 RepID=UPI0033CB7D6E